MRIYKIALGVLMVAPVLAGSALAQRLPPAITTDPPPDKDYPAGVEAPDIVSHGARLNTVLFLASGAAPHPTVLLLHGFPGNEKNLDLAYMLRRAGWNVLFPNYRGSWGSAGSFSFANVKKYRIAPERIVLIGHSMGGFMAAYTAAHDSRVYALCMLAAWNIGPSILRSADEGRADSYKNSSPRLAGTTPEGLMAEAKANALKWNYVDYAELLKTRPVLVVEPNDRNREDNQAMVEALRKGGNKQVVEKYIETDHSFSDHRIALQVAILEWLQSLPAPVGK